MRKGLLLLTFAVSALFAFGQNPSSTNNGTINANTFSFKAAAHHTEAVVKGIDETCTPPQNVAGTSHLDAVTLTWEEPYIAPTEEWLTWSGETMSGSIGTNAAAVFDVAHRYTAAQMAPYAGYTLTKVRFAPAVAANICTYSIKIWLGETNATHPQTLATTYEVPASAITEGEIVEVTLPNPVNLDGTKAMWVGYECNTSGGYPAGIDDQPAVVGFGNMINMGGWMALSSINPDLNNNWIIQALVTEGTKEITLSNDVNADVKQYNIFRDGTKVGNVDGATTTYTEEGVEDGVHSYCVTAVYTDDCESMQVCADVEVATTCWPVSDLNNTILAKKNVKLTWKAPVDPNAPKTWITWAGEPSGNAIGTGQKVNFSVAQRFEPADLTDYDGMVLTMVKILPNEQECVYTLKVWEGGSQTNPGDLMVDQVITQELSFGDWNFIELETPMTIDASKELWIGYECNTEKGHPAGVDAGPRVDFKGNMMYMDGQWTTMWEAGGGPEPQGAALDYNWCIQGGLKDAKGKVYTLSPLTVNNTTTAKAESHKLSVAQVATKAPKMPEVDFYRVYKNGELIKDNHVLMTYTDTNLPDGDYLYGVTAVYVNGCESEPVETDTITIDNDGMNDVNSQVSIYPNPANASLTINGVEMSNITIYNNLGQIVESVEVNASNAVINTSSYAAGVYFVNITTVNGETLRNKIVIKH